MSISVIQSVGLAPKKRVEPRLTLKCKLCGQNIKDDEHMVEHRRNKHTWDEVEGDDLSNW